MVAFLLAIAIFVYFLLLGITLSSFVDLKVRTSQRYLLAPALGISVQLFGTFVTNRMGVPVRVSAPWFFAVGLFLILKTQANTGIFHNFKLDFVICSHIRITFDNLADV